MPNANCPRPTVVTAEATPSVWSVTLGAPPIVSGALRLTGAACTTMLSRPGASGVTSPLESTRASFVSVELQVTWTFATGEPSESTTNTLTGKGHAR